MMTRRRFLTISAMAAMGGLTSAKAPAATNWRGFALGSEAAISISGDRSKTVPALTAALDTIRRMEKLFSLYDPSSSLSRLNRTGQLQMSPEFARLIHSVGKAHRSTGGLFDPTVQPVFAAHLRAGAQEKKTAIAGAAGWKNVDVTGDAIKFRMPDMAITLNGIAQGFATDRVKETLQAHGMRHVLVNVGEYRAGQSPANIGIADNADEIISKVQLREAALATSALDAYRFRNGESHILHPQGRSSRMWTTVSVQAATATMADAVSTALSLSEGTSLAEELKSTGQIQMAILKRASGEIVTI